MKKRIGGKIALNLFLFLGSLTFIIPLVMMCSISLSAENAITEYGYTVLPKVFSTAAYKSVFANPHQIIQAYKVTIAFSVLGTALSMLIQSMMAYSLSKSDFTGRKFFTGMLLFTMLFNGGLVPSYILNTQYLHLGNTFWIYIFPTLVSAFNVFMFRTNIAALPDGLLEAAKLDGASEFTIYFKIVFPLIIPILASLGFLSLLGRWNDWNTALLYIRDSELYSLQYLLQRILNEADYIKQMQKAGTTSMFDAKNIPGESLRYAMAVVAAGPMLVVFPFFQKYLSKGLTVGSVKG